MPTVLPIQSRSKVHEEVRDPPGQHHGDARLTETEEGVRPKSDLETQGSEEGPGDSGTKRPAKECGKDSVPGAPPCPEGPHGDVTLKVPKGVVGPEGDRSEPQGPRGDAGVKGSSVEGGEDTPGASGLSGEEGPTELTGQKNVVCCNIKYLPHRVDTLAAKIVDNAQVVQCVNVVHRSM